MLLSFLSIVSAERSWRIFCSGSQVTRSVTDYEFESQQSKDISFLEIAACWKRIRAYSWFHSDPGTTQLRIQTCYSVSVIQHVPCQSWGKKSNSKSLHVSLGRRLHARPAPYCRHLGAAKFRRGDDPASLRSEPHNGCASLLSNSGRVFCNLRRTRLWAM